MYTCKQHELTCFFFLFIEFLSPSLHPSLFSILPFPFSLPLSFPTQGKFIRINFDQSGYIAGANIETCM